MEREITLWAVAVLIVAAPTAIAFAKFMRHDQRNNERFATREDLLAHLDTQALSSFLPSWLLIAFVGGAFVAAVAIVAHWLKTVADWLF